MNAVICRFSFPFTTLDGVRAITTSNSALVPLVHHSFSPFRIHAWPSGVGTAVVSIAAGSEPTPGSVRAKAEIAPFARRGRYFFFWVSVPNSFKGWGTPLEFLEERLRASHLFGVLLGVRVDQVEAELPEEQVAHEARRGPLLLARGLGDFARLGGADFALRGRSGGGHSLNLPCGGLRQEARLEQPGGRRSAREPPEVSVVVDVGTQEARRNLVRRPNQEHEADPLVAQVEALLMAVQGDYHRGHDPENRPRCPNRRPGRQGGGEEGASEAAGKVHHRRPREAQGVLAGHAHHIQHQAVADQVIPAGVQEGRALETPPLACQHTVAHQGTRLHDAFTARERPGGELPREQRYVRGNEQENEGRGSPHPALEVDAGVGPRREHVGGDDDRLFPLVAHRRSPVSSITPSASATRRSRVRAPSALRSRT